MNQIALPLGAGTGSQPPRIVVGSANAAAIDAFAHAASWPFRTAILAGAPRSGKSLLARWFADSGQGDAIDQADQADEDALFHAWNRAQENGRPLLLVTGDAGWQVALPDLASRLGAALRLSIGAPDDTMIGELIALHAELRGFVLDETARAYLVPRCERSHMDVEKLVGAIDRLSLERKQAPGMAIWRDALAEVSAETGSSRPSLP